MGGDCRHLAREGHRQPIGGHLYGWFCDAMFQTSVVNTPDAITDLFQLKGLELCLHGRYGCSPSPTAEQEESLVNRCYQ